MNEQRRLTLFEFELSNDQRAYNEVFKKVQLNLNADLRKSKFISTITQSQKINKRKLVLQKSQTIFKSNEDSFVARTQSFVMFIQ